MPLGRLTASGRRGRAGAALRESLGARPLLPYEALMSADRPEGADAIRDAGWRLGEHPAIPMRAPLAWDEVAAADRSWHFHLHCWDGLAPLLAAHDAVGDVDALALAVEVALDWAGAFTSLRDASPFAWYDMAVGLRAYRLAYLIDAAARLEDGWDDDALGRLAHCALLHREALDDAERFAGHSNHGLYQALGALALARRLPELPGSQASHTLAAARVRALVEGQFTLEGVHREHSPGYHLLVLDAVLRAQASGLVADAAVAEVCARAEQALPWFVQPDGRLAMVGDTSYGFAPTGTYASPAARWVAGGGREGEPPAPGLRVYPASGYAMVREPWDADGSYLLLTASFHSRAHKHADDLACVWMERGVQLLADGGRFGYAGRTRPGDGLWELGYNYDDPGRVYVESASAHSTVEVDGTTHSRRDAHPYGSGIGRHGTFDGLHVVEGAVSLRPGARHARLLVLAPGRWLLVIDEVVHDEQRDLRQRFLLGPELELVGDEAAAPRFRLPRGGEELHLVSLTGAPVVELVRGQEEPRRLGWISRRPRRLEPTWSCAVAADGVRAHRFATLLALTGERPRVRRVELEAGLVGGEVSWEGSTGRDGVAFAAPADGALVARAVS